MKTACLVLFLFSSLSFAQEKPERFKIYRLSESNLGESSTGDTTYGVIASAYSSTKGEVVFLLDTQTGKTWYLGTVFVPDTTSNKVIWLKYAWEPVYFHERSPKHSTTPK